MRDLALLLGMVLAFGGDSFGQQAGDFAPSAIRKVIEEAAGSLEPAGSGRIHGGVLEFAGADFLFGRTRGEGMGSGA